MGKWWEAPSDLVGVPHVWRPGNPILEGVAQIHCRNLQQRPSRGGTALGHVRWLAALLHCWCFTERRKILKPQWILSRPRPCLMSAARMGIPDRIVHLMRRLWEITGFWGTKGFNFWSQHHGSGCFKKCHGIEWTLLAHGFASHFVLLISDFFCSGWVWVKNDWIPETNGSV